MTHEFIGHFSLQDFLISLTVAEMNFKTVFEGILGHRPESADGFIVVPTGSLGLVSMRKNEQGLGFCLLRGNLGGLCLTL